MTRERAFIGLGGNVGDVVASFRTALWGLGVAGCSVVSVSRLYRSSAWVAPGATTLAPDYLNAACCVETSLPPLTLLASLHALEAAAGRVRHTRWAPRTLDLDVLLYGDQVVASNTLQVPHPGLTKRPFVLLPLVDIAPTQKVPPTGVTVADLLAKHPEPWSQVWLEADSGW